MNSYPIVTLDVWKTITGKYRLLEKVIDSTIKDVEYPVIPAVGTKLHYEGKIYIVNAVNFIGSGAATTKIVLDVEIPIDYNKIPE